MKKKILSTVITLIFAICCVCLTACGNNEVWNPPTRVKLSLTEKLHVEYINKAIIGDSTLPNYCVLVKDGDIYYVKTPTIYSSDRLEVYEKVKLNNAVEFAGLEYGQAYISARWDEFTDSWLIAADETDLTPFESEYHANDRNNHVYLVGIAFLDVGYGDVNHIYENGVADKDGHKYTATQKNNETLLIGENNVTCVVWEYEEYHGENIWSKSKFWFDAETGVTLKKTMVLPSSDNQSLDADENIGLIATYFSKTDTMQSYLASADRLPSPDFSAYN